VLTSEAGDSGAIVLFSLDADADSERQRKFQQRLDNDANGLCVLSNWTLNRFILCMRKENTRGRNASNKSFGLF
jgi:hypothetical protein